MRRNQCSEYCDHLGRPHRWLFETFGATTRASGSASIPSAATTSRENVITFHPLPAHAQLERARHDAPSLEERLRCVNPRADPHVGEIPLMFNNMEKGKMDGNKTNSINSNIYLSAHIVGICCVQNKKLILKKNVAKLRLSLKAFLSYLGWILNTESICTHHSLPFVSLHTFLFDLAVRVRVLEGRSCLFLIKQAVALLLECA